MPSKGQVLQAIGMLYEHCQEKTNAEPDDISGICDGNFPEDKVPLKEYTCCVLDMLRVMNGDKFEPDEALDNLKDLPDRVKKHLMEGINQCRNSGKNGSTCAETAYEVVKCFKATLGKYFFFPCGTDELPPEE
uniref:Chemosensory protein n=1 Tax=Blattella germanica TaxID=6973 RepID=A0A0X8DBG6_BLAGE|nr:chemosensory protein [Blattella germanica]